MMRANHSPREHASQIVDMPNDQPGAMYLDDLKTWIDSYVLYEY